MEIITNEWFYMFLYSLASVIYVINLKRNGHTFNQTLWRFVLSCCIFVCVCSAIILVMVLTIK